MSLNELSDGLPVALLVSMLSEGVVIDDFKLALSQLLIKLSLQLVSVPQLAPLDCVKIPAVLRAQLGHLSHVVLFGEVQLVLQIVDVALQVQSHLLHALLQG